MWWSSKEVQLDWTAKRGVILGNRLFNGEPMMANQLILLGTLIGKDVEF